VEARRGQVHRFCGRRGAARQDPNGGAATGSQVWRSARQGAQLACAAINSTGHLWFILTGSSLHHACGLSVARSPSDAD
jgi:hypothetical protein